MSRLTAIFALFLLPFIMTACDQHVASVADWEKTTMPALDGAEEPPKQVGTVTIWQRGHVEYCDTDADGIIDQRTVSDSKGKTILWMDVNGDSVFDVEYVSILGISFPRDTKAISVPVPATK